MNIKFISLNIWHGVFLFQEVLDFLKKQDADIVVLQEVYSSKDSSLKEQFRTMQIYKEKLDYPEQVFSPHYRDFDNTNGKSQRGNAILSKFPIKLHDDVFFAKEYSEEYRDSPGHYHECPRSLQHITIDTPSGELDVYNIQGVYDLNGDNFSPERQRMSEVILNAIDGKDNVILAGDTNAKPTNSAIKMIESKLNSVFGNELQTSFNMRRKDNPGYATTVVDMILVSNNISVKNKQCLDIDISDHLPLVVELQVN